MNNRFNQVYEIIKPVGFIVSLAAEGYALYLVITNKSNSTLFFFIGLIVFLVVLIFTALKYREKANNNYKLYCKFFHQCNHSLRDEIFAIEKLKNNNEIKNYAVLNASLKKTGEECVNLLQNLLTQITHKEISVHIKHFTAGGEKDVYRTLCISTNSNTDRLTLNDHPITKNTMMEWIVKGTENHFESSNLKKDILRFKSVNKENFKISYTNWENWFNSIIIVPIRIHSSFKDSKDDSKYIYLGFICVDAKETNAFGNKAEVKGHIDVIKALADGLYTYLDTISRYTEYLSNISSHDKIT